MTVVWTVCDSSPLETMSAAGHCNIETTESHWYIQYVWFGAGHMIIETMGQTKMSTRWHFSNYQVVEYFNISGCIITRFWPYRTTLLSINCTEELQYYTFSWLFALLWSSILICQVFAGWFKKKKNLMYGSIQFSYFGFLSIIWFFKCSTFICENYTCIHHIHTCLNIFQFCRFPTGICPSSNRMNQ